LPFAVSNHGSVVGHARRPRKTSRAVPPDFIPS
jgi:hypothetical protein